MIIVSSYKKANRFIISNIFVKNGNPESTKYLGHFDDEVSPVMTKTNAIRFRDRKTAKQILSNYIKKHWLSLDKEVKTQQINKETLRLFWDSDMGKKHLVFKIEGMRV